LIVVDTNLLAYAVLAGEHSELAERVALRDSDWIAPALWRHELANILATAMRVRGLSLTEALYAFAAAERLVVDAEIEPELPDRLELAARGKISAYDAEFVAVALRLDLPLVTADRRLAQAFPKAVLRIEEFVVE
jgi:predicted nucleic acid-binding protein